MTFEWSQGSEAILNQLMHQNVDIHNIPIYIERTMLKDGDIHLVIRPAQHPKDKFQLGANKHCSSCGGFGWIRYQIAQDDIKSAPCHICFPETKDESEYLRSPR